MQETCINERFNDKSIQFYTYLFIERRFWSGGRYWSGKGGFGGLFIHQNRPSPTTHTQTHTPKTVTLDMHFPQHLS